MQGRAGDAEHEGGLALVAASVLQRPGDVAPLHCLEGLGLSRGRRHQRLAERGQIQTRLRQIEHQKIEAGVAQRFGSRERVRSGGGMPACSPQQAEQFVSLCGMMN